MVTLTWDSESVFLIEIMQSEEELIDAVKFCDTPQNHGMHTIMGVCLKQSDG